MIQGKRKCLNFVCFEPEKKRTLTNLLGSPVKVNKTKTSKRSTDLQFTKGSEITHGEQLDFEIIDMTNLTIKDPIFCCSFSFKLFPFVYFRSS